MAGERMRFPGYTEVSGVCTHPKFRNRGLAGRCPLLSPPVSQLVASERSSMHGKVISRDIAL